MITNRKKTDSMATAPDRRAGAAMAEFAILLPLLLVLVFGAIEACTMIFLKQSVTLSAYEGARIAVDDGVTTASVKAACQQIIDDRNINDATITTSPADVEKAKEGTEIVITVSAPCNSNTILQGWFFNNTKLTGQVVMMKEF